MTFFQKQKARIMGRYRLWTFRPHVIDRRVAGEEIRFFIGDAFGQGWYGPHHDPWPELEWIKQSGIRPGDVVVDCGANHGFSTVLFSRWTGPAGRVVAIEPLPHNVEILQRNLELNGSRNVTVHPIAAGSESGTITISTHPNAAVLRDGPSAAAGIQVPVRTLDETVPDAHVDFLKIDVEGFELNVLRGAQRLLACRPRLAIELHVFTYADKVRELTEIFALLPSGQTTSIQSAVDGPVVRFDAAAHSPEALAQLEVVHLFTA